ncbi:MAG: DEAD/DEAH box helicase [Planctomycetota bacterium]
MTDFEALGVRREILSALRERGYETPTPIQAASIPPLLEGSDLLGIAQTGTGKTAAFSIPMLQILHEDVEPARSKRPRALIMAPTRELASQIKESCIAYGDGLKLRIAIVFGGVGQMPQVRTLQKGVDVLIATPGRLLDLMQQGHCLLEDVEILVLDEADRMLDMGFLPDVRRILSKVPKDRQTLLFSATMPGDISALSKQILHKPERVAVTPPAATAERVEQAIFQVQKSKKRDVLVKLLSDPVFVRTLVFTRTKHGADRVARHLHKAGIPSHAIHGNKSQGARERALGEFKSGKAVVLVATDIAARGIDVPEISHVVNFDLPNIPESYVHRIGRTARAGREGIAISFCDETEHEYLRDIEKLIRQSIPRRSLTELKHGVAESEAGESGGGDGDGGRERPQVGRPTQRMAAGPYENSDEVRRPHAGAKQRSGGGRSRGGGRSGGGRPGGGRSGGGNRSGGQGGGGGRSRSGSASSSSGGSHGGSKPSGGSNRRRR